MRSEFVMFRISVFISLIFLLVTKVSFAQLVADAGPDQVYCNWFDTTYIVLGGDPTASGGIEPYTYMWGVDHPWGIEVFVDDPTLANPLMLYPPPVGQSVWQLYLTVTDADQNVSMDTVEVVFSEFMMHTGHYIFTIDLGDTICFPEPNTFGGFPPQEYLWRPNHGLIDSIGWSMCAAPEYTTNYYVVLTDSVGCVINGSPFVLVIVNPVDIDEQAKARNEINLFPNPAHDFITIDIDPGIQGVLMFRLFDQQGVLVFQEQLHDRQSGFDLSGLSSGLYVYNISNGAGFEYAGKIKVSE